MAEKDGNKEKDVKQIIRYLSSTFNQATAHLERAYRSPTEGPNATYQLQVDFAYLLNEVAQGPKCLIQKHITACNEFIDQVIEQNPVR